MSILRINSMREIYSVCKYKVTQIACTCDVTYFVSTCDSFRIYMSRPYIVCISIRTFKNSTGPCHDIWHGWWVLHICVRDSSRNTGIWCSVLQCVAVCCSVCGYGSRHEPLERFVTWSMSTHTATHCNTLQHTATHCIALQQPPIMCSNTLQQTPIMCKYLFDHLKTAPVRDMTWPLSSARAVRDMIHVNSNMNE